MAFVNTDVGELLCSLLDQNKQLADENAKLLIQVYSLSKQLEFVEGYPGVFDNQQDSLVFKIESS